MRWRKLFLYVHNLNVVQVDLYHFNTIFAIPFNALGYEMTPDYHERPKVMAWANWLGQIPWLLCPWFWWMMANKKFFATPVAGAQAIGPILQGFAKPISDLSRGATVDDIVATASLLLAMSLK